jgi:HK97 family phage prohead protease
MSKVDPNNYKTKAASFQVKEMEDKEGIVVAYANLYNNEDYDGDISLPGSFDKTINEKNLKKLKVLKDHNRFITLGVPIEKPKTNDPIGLLTTTKFNLNKEVARDMFSDIQLNMQYQKEVDLSIGFNVVKRDEKDYRKIKEYALWEYTFLSSWGANPGAIVQGVKSSDKLDYIKTFLVDAYNLNYSDNRLIQIETILKSLDGQEPAKPLLPKEPTIEEIKSLIISKFK